MTISYNWLLEYLPVPVEPERLEKILNSIGLEVEGIEKYEEVKGGLIGLVIGKVLETSKHPNADKLTLTKVDIGGPEPLQIVCGAPNVASGQKVVVAPVGSTIYPMKSEPMTMRVAKIRGVESQGMICAEDELGLGESHEGIMVLPESVVPGQTAASFFEPYTDYIISIGLTPNRSDAMSHLGVARDICAYLSHHHGTRFRVKSPLGEALPEGDRQFSVSVTVENTISCPRYAGITISQVTVKPSPPWMQKRLKAIGMRPINNIVDITNYILHETGQPLHAFDADKIRGNRVIVRNLPAGTLFKGLDEKERRLDETDLMICDGESHGMCIGGVFGGYDSGVTEQTRNIFLESAWFDPVSIRKSSFRHNLRTDAATRFEKGVDIGNTVEVLKRAAGLICAYAGGTPASGIIDIYPQTRVAPEITVTYDYLRRISGKSYAPEQAGSILESLGFAVKENNSEQFTVVVPTHKTDISLPADIAEEIMRIDGFDNIAIPSSITISPASEPGQDRHTIREKTANMLAGMGFSEILNNSITSSAFFTPEELKTAVHMLNNLSAELDILRPSMLETGLQTLAHNLNRKNLDLRFFEFGKTYATTGTGQYAETDHLALYVTGNKSKAGWKSKPEAADFFYLKGVLNALLAHSGIRTYAYSPASDENLENALQLTSGNNLLAVFGPVSRKRLQSFDIRQDVWFADIAWDNWTSLSASFAIRFKEIPRFPAVERDLAFVVDQHLDYKRIEKTIHSLSLDKLKSVNLFDVFESEKFGAGKKSMAMNFIFQDQTKTLTDEVVDGIMNKIITIFENELNAEIRR